jgi:DNA-binding transcriptional ArsR family regulator
MPGPRPSRHPRTGDTPSPPSGVRRSGLPSSVADLVPSSPPSTGPASGSRLDVLRALAHLTDRDLLIADWLDQHGVLTTAQLAAALFGSLTTASHRLAKLRAIGLVDRFHRPQPAGGFGPWHWVIGPLGAQLTAAARDAAPPTPRQLALRHARLAASSHLTHRLGANGFFIDLYAAARSSDGDMRLVRWWSEIASSRRYHQRIHPDGHALWHQDGTTIGVFLEYDTGTEDLARLARKLSAYDQLAADGGPAYPVLFWLHSDDREHHLHQVLADRRAGPVPAATAVRGKGSPADPIWSLDGRHRLVLAHLPFDHGDPESMYNPNLTDPDLDQLL